MSYKAINFAQKFALFDEQWAPKVIAEMNDYQFKVVKLQGDFIWHEHNHTDETFMVIDGTLRIDFRDGSVHVAKGEMFVVPKGSSTSRPPNTWSCCCSSSRAGYSTQATRVACAQQRMTFPI